LTVRLALLPSRSLSVPLNKPAPEVLAFLEGVIQRQRALQVAWPSERARLNGSVTPDRILLRFGTRNQEVTFVGSVEDGGNTIRGNFVVSFRERLFFNIWCSLLGALLLLGVAVSLLSHRSAHEVTRLLAVGLAILILGFFATRLSWLGRSSHVSWIADLLRRAAC
jgi:hypothetical protein